MINIKESNVTIMVADLSKSISFYESIGFTLKNRWDDHYAMVTAEGITIGLHPSVTYKDITICSNISIGLIVDDISEAKKLLNEKKIEYREDDGKSGFYLHFMDIDGTLLYFTQPNWKY